jgi:hypothetical protein
METGAYEATSQHREGIAKPNNSSYASANPFGGIPIFGGAKELEQVIDTLDLDFPELAIY